MAKDGSITYKVKADLSQYNQDMDGAKSTAQKAFDGISAAGKVAMAAIGTAVVAAAGKLTGMVKDSLSAVGNYEQLTGGVETLFKNSADTVMKYAENAYKTAGLSANQYMETVTSFSASLLQGLGGDTEQAAKVADLAITDMSDNANKMGTSMESIQNAYQGFAKANYTMLDNLKLGYGGTATEMVRLINDANKVDSTILGVNQSIENLDGITFDQIIRSIHAIQDSLDITGTTAKEASTTIEGSMNAAKAAWDNFLSGAGDVDSFVDAFGTALDNIVTNLRDIIPRLSRGIVEIVDKISPMIPDVISELLPTIVNALIRLASDIARSLPKILASVGKALQQNIGSLLKLAWIPLVAFSNKLLPLFKDMFGGIGTAIKGGLDSIKQFGTSSSSISAAFSGIKNAAAETGDKIKGFFSGFGGYAIAVGALAAIGAAVEAISMKPMEEAIERIDANKQAIDNLRQSYEELEQTTQNRLATTLNELDKTEELAKEFETLIDANGRVKEGYEARAEFIAGFLNDTLGTEIQIVDGVATGYDNLTDSIYDLIEAKRIEAVTEYYNDQYVELLAQQEEATKALTEAVQAEAQAYADAGDSISLAEQAVIDDAHRHTVEAQNLLNDINAAVENNEEVIALAADGNIEAAQRQATQVGIIEQELTGLTEEQVLARISYLQKQCDDTAALYRANGDETTKQLLDTYSSQLADAADYYNRYYGKTAEGMDKSRRYIKDSMTSTKSEAKQGGIEIGDNLVTGMGNGIEAKLWYIRDKAAKMAAAAKAAAEAELQVQSPSKVFKRIGSYVSEGMALGIESNAKAPVNAVRNMTSAMTMPNITYLNTATTNRRSYTNNNAITIAKLADSIVVREDADIDRISNALYKKMQHYNRSRGVS